MPPTKVKAKAKPRKVATDASKSVKFRSRGPFKCTTQDGKALKGIHKALAEAISSGFNYDQSKKNNTLQVVPHPPATEFYPRHAHAKNERHLAYSAAQGKKADSQLTSVVKLHLMPTQLVPLRAFVDADFRNHWIALNFRHLPNMTDKQKLVLTKQAKRIRNLANGLFSETDAVIRFMITKKLSPVSTQTPVASGAVGTQLDLLCKNADNEHIVIEMKTGCEKSFTHGKMMPAPFQTLLFNTHREHILQTLMTSRCYRRTYPTRKVGAPLLLRSSRDGIHVYSMPQWAIDGEQALAMRMRMK